MKYLSQTSFRCGTSDIAQANFAIIFDTSTFDRAVICQSKGNGEISSELYRMGWLLMVSAFVLCYQLCRK